MKQKDFRALRKVLVYLYKTKSDLKVIAEDIEIDLSMIELDGTSQAGWHSVLEEAEKTGKINALLDRVKENYGKNSEFKKVYQDYYQPVGHDRHTGSISNVPTQRKVTSSSLIAIWAILIIVTGGFIYLAYSGVRSNLKDMFKVIEVPEITADEITSTAGITNTGEITSQPTIHSESLIGQIARVDPVTAWNGLCLRKSIDEENIPPCIDGKDMTTMEAGDTVTVLSNDESGWIKAKHNQSGREGYVMLRYLLFTEVQDTYINLFWRYKNPDDTIDDDCITAPRLELLSVNQPESFCDPNVPVMSLDKLEEALYNQKMLDPDESIQPWKVDNGASIIVKTGNNSDSDFIKINKYPKSSKQFLVGAIWREIPYPGTPIRKICWLRTNREWFCDAIP